MNESRAICTIWLHFQLNRLCVGIFTASNKPFYCVRFVFFITPIPTASLARLRIPCVRVYFSTIPFGQFTSYVPMYVAAYVCVCKREIEEKNKIKYTQYNRHSRASRSIVQLQAMNNNTLIIFRCLIL